MKGSYIFMRMRKKKCTPKRLEMYKDFFIHPKEGEIIDLKAVFGNDNPVKIEIGAGKGNFITQLARLNPDINYIAFEKCDDVIILTLTIEEIVGVDNLRISDLIMVPNPVAIGEELYVGADFTSEELEDMIVEVFNVTGQCVYRLESAQHSIVNSQFVITGLHQAGVYMVNITTATGSRYHGKVIVK
jgi:hypothetical protein